MCEFVDKIGFTPVEPITFKFINSHVETPTDLQPAGGSPFRILAMRLVRGITVLGRRFLSRGRGRVRPATEGLRGRGRARPATRDKNPRPKTAYLVRKRCSWA